MKNKLFRWHQGGLQRSLDTTVEVHSISEMRAYILRDFPADNYLHNIRIDEKSIDDSSRAGSAWADQHMVVADFEGHTGQCLGWCNFIADATPQELLEEAIKIAADKHSGQVDKGGMPYILHPLRVMMRLQREYRDKRDKENYWNMCMAAVLHDVIEDTPTTLEEVSTRGFNQGVIDILSILTKGPEEEYNEYIHRIVNSKNKQAIVIKIADLYDNMDKDRLPTPITEKDNQRIEKYLAAYALLDAKKKEYACL